MNETPLKKNDVIEIEIDGIGYEGEGIAHLGGFTVFIRYALPGEKVRATVILVKSTFAVGKLLRVLRASPDRAEPFCPVYYTCGGCALQHMRYEAQLRYKTQALCDTLRKTAHLSPSPETAVPSPIRRNYRNKMSLPVRGVPAVLGFFATGTHRVVPIDACPIQFAENGAILSAFRSFLHEAGLTGYNETDRTGDIRHLSVRKLDGFFTVTAVANTDCARALQPFASRLQALTGDRFAYYVNENRSAGNRILGDESQLLGGAPQPVQIDGLAVTVHPHSFFQVNDGIRAALYAAVCAEAKAAEVIDAYSGAGVLSALLSRHAQTVTAVEIEPKAVASAEDLLRRNDIRNVRTLCGDCARLLPQIAAQSRHPCIVLDPPRAGCDAAVLAAVVRAEPQKIVYISCNPATLARDTARLQDAGYAPVRIVPFDMFAQCAGLETMAVFTRAPLT